ncbi:MAG: hypothetical protein M3O06_11580 [Pseudomonadota bacterium]|nr:hypothetical protein [Pseudomonadota bacterium]
MPDRHGGGGPGRSGRGRGGHRGGRQRGAASQAPRGARVVPWQPGPTSTRPVRCGVREISI